MINSSFERDRLPDMERIREALHFIPASDRDTWVKMGMAVKSELGDTGFDVWEEWSQQDESFDPTAARDVWKSIRGNGKVTIGTLFHKAKAHGWRDDGTHQKPTPGEIAAQRRTAAERAAKEDAEKACERAEAAKKAAAIWKAAEPASADHPYLSCKHVSPVETLREIVASAAAAILGYVPKAKGDQLAGRLLVVPVKVGDALSTLELIDEAGHKSALYGGEKKGGYWAAQPLPEGDGLTFQYGEGVATTLTAKEANGNVSIAALSASNLPAVMKYFHQRYPAAVHIALADLVKATDEPDPRAIDAARAVGGLVAIPDFGIDRPEAATDMNDLAQQCGAEAVRHAIAGATAPAREVHQPDTESLPAVEPAIPGTPGRASPATETDEQTISRLAALPMLDYDRERKAEAKALGIRPGTLDKIVSTKRGPADTGGMDFEEVEPWPDEINHGKLLSEISHTVQRFIVCSRETADTVALWSVMTWLMDVVQVAPLAVITSPEKRCGKSLLLFLMGKLAYRPMAASNISPAAMYRAIDAWNPTLLVDETDAFMRENEELRGIVNAGHTRDSAYVVRTVGEDFTPKRFSVWGAKALAGIGHLADTLMDRAIVLELRRKLPHENVERLRHAQAGLFQDQAAKLARFADDCRQAVKQARPVLPESLNDRQQDNWEPLLAIAGTAGDDWIVRAHNAALKLSNADELEHGIGNELLADIQAVFATKKVDKISTADLIEELCSDGEAPWNTYNRGKPVSPRQIAKRLKGYGITSKNIAIGYERPKGFELEQFEESFSRYLSPPVFGINPLLSSTGAAFHGSGEGNVSATAATYPLPATESGINPDRKTVARSGYSETVADRKTPSATLKPAPVLEGSGVADKRGGGGSGNFVEVDV